MKNPRSIRPGVAASTVLEVAGTAAFICVALGVASDSVDLTITPGVGAGAELQLKSHDDKTRAARNLSQ